MDYHNNAYIPEQASNRSIAVQRERQGSAIDSASLFARCRGNTGFALSLLQLFQDTKVEQVNQLAIQIAREDLSAAAEIAHSLKGAANTITAEALARIASEIEEAAKDGDQLLVTTQFKELRAEVDRCHNCISQMVQRISSG